MKLGHIENITRQFPQDKVEIEFRTKISEKQFYRLIRGLDLQQVKSYSYKLYDIYNADSTLRQYEETCCSKTSLIRTKSRFFDVNYILSVSLEETIVFNKENLLYRGKRTLKRYFHTLELGITMMVSEVDYKHETQTKFFELEVEVDETQKLGKAKIYFLSLLSMIRFPFNMPVHISDEEDIKKKINTMYLSPKVDGIRRFVVIYEGLVWDYDRRAKVHLNKNVQNQQNMILDCEFLDDNYVVLDTPLLEVDYILRRNFLDDYLLKLDVEGVNFHLKKLNKDSYSNCNDGWILTSPKAYQETSYKIKPNPTVDIIIPLERPVQEYLDSKGIKLELPKLPGIYEIDLQGRVLRLRDDKPKPNPLNLVKQIFEENFCLTKFRGLGL